MRALFLLTRSTLLFKLIFCWMSNFTLANTAQADETLSGRLFTTPAQRAKLNQERKLGHKVDLKIDQKEQADQATTTPSTTTLDGYVVRSSGTTTTWINSVAHTENEHSYKASSLQISQQPSHDPAIVVKTESGKRVNVKVGDTVDMQTGAIRKVYEPAPATPDQK